MTNVLTERQPEPSVVSRARVSLAHGINIGTLGPLLALLLAGVFAAVALYLLLHDQPSDRPSQQPK